MRRATLIGVVLAAWLLGAGAAPAQRRVIFQTHRPPFQQPRAPFQSPGPGPAVWIAPWARTQPVVNPANVAGQPVQNPAPRFYRLPMPGTDPRGPADQIPPGGN